MSNQRDRRTVLKLLGASAALGAVSEPAVAAATGESGGGDAPRSRGDQPSTVGGRSLGYDVRVSNRRGDTTVTVTIRRVTPGVDNPTVFTDSYDVAAGRFEKGDVPGRLGTPGMFEVEVAVDGGPTRTTNWWMPAERIPPNRGLDVTIRDEVVIDPVIA